MPYSSFTLQRKYYQTVTEILRLCDSVDLGDKFVQIASTKEDNRVADRIVVQARTWLGTPFKHQGRKKGVGVDCLGLLVGIAEELNLQDERGKPLAAFDALDYGHLPDEKRLWRGLKSCLSPNREGNIALFHIDGTARHLGIIARDKAYRTLIHAYAPARKVVEHRLDEMWESRIVELFEI